MAPEHRAIRRHESAGRALVTHAAQEALAPIGGSMARASDIGVAADRDAAPVDRAGHARRRVLPPLRCRQGEGQPARPGGGDDGLGDRVLRGLIEAGRQPENLVVRRAGRRLDGGDATRARR